MRLKITAGTKAASKSRVRLNGRVQRHCRKAELLWAFWKWFGWGRVEVYVTDKQDRIVIDAGAPIMATRYGFVSIHTMKGDSR